MASFLKYLDELRVVPKELKPDPEPVGKANVTDEQKWEREYIKASGSLFKAVMRAGTEEVTPKDGQEVTVHYTCRSGEKEDGEILASTRIEHGGTGVPAKILLVKDDENSDKLMRILRGFELGIRQMCPGERSILKVKYDYGYGHKSTESRGLSAPKSIDAKEDLFFDAELLLIENVKPVDYEEGKMIKKTLKEGEGWETPREPFEVRATIQGATIVHDGNEEFLPETEVSYTVGDGQLPKGLEMCIDTMSMGETARFVCQQPYASQAAPLVPRPPGQAHAPNGVQYIVTCIHFMQVRDLFGDEAVYKRRTKPGIGEFPVDCPMNDCQVRFQYSVRGSVGGSAVYASSEDSASVSRHGDGGVKTLALPLGQGMMPEAMDTSLRLALPQEVSHVRGPLGRMYDGYEDMIPESLAKESKDRIIEWELTLVGFDKPVNWYQVTFEEALEEVRTQKEQGNYLFKRGRYHFAKTKYHKTTSNIDGLRGLEPEQFSTMEEIKVACHLNWAQCCIKEEKWFECIDRLSEKVLKHHPDNPKGLYRRGLARIHVGFFEEAREDLERVKIVDPTLEKDADVALRKLERFQREALIEEKRAYGGKLKK